MLKIYSIGGKVEYQCLQIACQILQIRLKGGLEFYRLHVRRRFSERFLENPGKIELALKTKVVANF